LPSLLATLASAALAGWPLACGGSESATAESASAAVRGCRDDLALSTKECEDVVALALPEALPPARGNRFGDDARAIELGFRVFFDARFSNVPDVRCATCHLPEKAFGDGLMVSRGRSTLTRNSPTILTAAWMSSYFWDGRADTLWSQPLFAFENKSEMEFSRLELAHAIYASPYRAMYEEIFGVLPDLSDMARFPARGLPGDAAFDALLSADRAAINRVAANMGKALEAYMRKVAVGRAPVDLYLQGDRTAMSEPEKKGLATFVRAKCIACHSGPALSNGKFYNMNVPSLPGAAHDTGRVDGLRVLAANVFNAQGPYYDKDGTPPPMTEATSGNSDDGAFRTPTLRHIGSTAPYGHNGVYPTLEALLSQHGDVTLDAEQTNSIMVFLLSLVGTYPARPWSDWPAR
jgi:cytochrome c peroxidase